MRVKTQELTLDSLSKHCYTRRGCCKATRRRYFATQTPLYKDAITNVAVLGGGITGLASAYFLTRELPHAKVTLYESSSRLGGWLQSKYVDVDNGKVLFEQGPRTLRPNFPSGAVTAMLMQELGLLDEILYTPKSAPASRNRFIYYPDHLVRMPGPGMTFWEGVTSLATEPLFRGFLWAVLGEAFRAKRSAGLEDESVGAFISRRLGKNVANNIVSAVLHGIYAGDVWQLSAKSLFPKQWMWEMEFGNITQAAIAALGGEVNIMSAPDAEMIKEIQTYPWDAGMRMGLKNASVFTFKKGVGQLAERLDEKLRDNENVTIKTQTRVERIKADEAGIIVRAATKGKESERLQYDHVISTVASPTLSAVAFSTKSLLSPTSLLPSLASTQAVTVMVVNLYFAQSNALPLQGFGYLLPNCVPFAQNPEFALGVVFDSDAVPTGQDQFNLASGAPESQPVPGGTKVTVMLGGHWWNAWSSYPSEDEGAAMAMTVLARHLNITAEPAAVHVTLQKNCIPQYTVGHDAKMRAAHKEIKEAFGGRLRVAGNWYGMGVGLNDCVRGARDVVRALVRDPESGTGLEGVMKASQWVRVKTVKKGVQGDD